MCIDANAGARRAARQRNREKHANFQQKSLQFFNKETSLARAQNRNVMGYSRDLSDAYVRAIYTQGKGRLRNQKLVADYFGKKKIDQGGRSRTFGKKQYQGLLRSQAEIQGITRNMFGRNMAYAQEGARRKFQAANAQARQKLGIPPAFGAPVMLPPTDYFTGGLQLLSTVSSIASPFIIKSDKRVKENIEQVGVSPQGYKIYEFNYIGGDVRFRGAMAQDVLKKNPMAVGIDQNYLTVDYSKIDVGMEVV
ncbi:MAG: hypothetical protein CMC78_03170 [Flavobacteriaceae bacterium]|nr:hypothetical protein [Flavobacteriaceae bacterium]